MIEIGRLHHITLCIADLEASRHFYCDILGMQEVERPSTFAFEGQWFRKNGYEVHTIHKDAAGQPPGDAPTAVRRGRNVTRARHVAFTIEDVDAAVQTLTQHDIEIVAGPRPRGDGAIQIYFYDPDGHMVELLYEP